MSYVAKVWLPIVAAAVAVFLLPFGAALLVPDQDEIAGAPPGAPEEEDPMYECLEQARGTVSKSKAKTVIRDCQAQARKIRAERDREAGVRPVGLPPATDPNAPRGGERCAPDGLVTLDAETEERYGWMMEEFGFLPPEAGYVCVEPGPEPVHAGRIVN